MAMSAPTELGLLKQELAQLEKRYQWRQVDRGEYLRLSSLLQRKIEQIEGVTAAPPPKTLTLKDFAAIINQQHGLQLQSYLHSYQKQMLQWLDEIEHVEYKPLPLETTFGEIIAFRIWRVSQGLLISSYTDHQWLPGATMTAHCKPRDRDDARSSEKTGIHGWKSVFEVASYAEGLAVNSGYNVRTDSFDCCSLVIGRVKLWGEVVEHQRGYRAEFAKIVSLDDCQSSDGNFELSYRHHGPILKLRWNGELLAQLQARYFPKEAK